MKKAHIYKTISSTGLFLTMLLFTFTANAQNDAGRISIGLHFDPLVSWFGSDIRETDNEGARPGYNLGITFNKFFSSNYAISGGLSLINAGGRLKSTDTTIMKFSNFTSTVLPGRAVIYKIQYLSIPIGLKLQTNEIGYVTYFTNIGIDPKFVVGSKVNIPDLEIKGENASEEVKMFNMGYHIAAGIEYSLGGTTALVLGLRFENNFLDITKDRGEQRGDKVTHRMLGVNLGINF